MVPTNVTQMKVGGAGATVIPAHSRFEIFSRFARYISGLTAHPATFVCAVLAVLFWAACGPASHYSEIWQLWINTSTTILTFLMVFLLQNAQMRDTKALHVKLDELLRAIHGARNELIDLENLSETELDQYCAEFSQLHKHYSEAIARRKNQRTNNPPSEGHG